MKGLLPVLDDLDRAEKHGDLVEGTPFAAIAEKVRGRGRAPRRGRRTAPSARSSTRSSTRRSSRRPPPASTETTVLEVVEVGYRLGSVELRPAKVVVAVPAE